MEYARAVGRCVVLIYPRSNVSEIWLQYLFVMKSRKPRSLPSKLPKPTPELRKKLLEHQPDMASFHANGTTQGLPYGSHHSGCQHATSCGLPDLLPDIRSKRSSSTPVEISGNDLQSVNYFHSSEAGIPQDKKRVRSLISTRQHQRERSLALKAKKSNNKGHSSGGWLQPDSADGLPIIFEPAHTPLGDETQPSTAITLEDPFAVHSVWDQQYRAGNIEESIIKSCRNAFEKGYPHTLSVLDNLVDLHISQGRGRDAVRLGQKVFKMCLYSLGEGHHHTLTSMENLAATYGMLGRSFEQRKLKTKLVKVQSKWLGEDHRDTIATRNQLVQMVVGSARQIGMLRFPC